MSSIYVLNTQPAQLTLALPGNDYLSYTFENEINEIIAINPDQVWVNCSSEMEMFFIFRNLIEGLRSWCVEQNKKIIMHMPTVWEQRIIDDPIIDARAAYGYHLHINRFNQTEYNHVIQTDFSNLYTCYNRRQDYHRSEIIKQLYKADLFDQGIITYQITEQHDDPQISLMFKDIDLSDPLEENFELHKTTTPEALPASYLTSLVDIVTESRFRTEKEFFFTEKTNKPLVTLKPFLVMSTQGFHKRLQEEYGIEPYTEIFNYAFDNESDYKLRARGIVQNITRLNTRCPTPESRRELSEYLMPKLLANKKAHLDYIVTEEKMMPEAYKIFKHKDNILYGNWEACIGDWINHAQEQGWIPEDTYSYLVEQEVTK